MVHQNNKSSYNYKRKRSSINVDSVKKAIDKLPSNVKFSKFNNKYMDLLCKSVKVINNCSNRTKLCNIWHRYIRSNVSTNMAVIEGTNLSETNQNNCTISVELQNQNEDELAPLLNINPITFESNSLYDIELNDNYSKISESQSHMVCLTNSAKNGEELFSDGLNEAPYSEILNELIPMPNANSNNNAQGERQLNEIKEKSVKIVYSKCDFMLTISEDVWKQIFSPEDRILDSFMYRSVIIQKLTKITGCLIKIKGYDILKKHLTIRTYCGHRNFNTTCRKYKLINKNLSHGVFEVYSTSDRIMHLTKKFSFASGYSREIYKKQLLEKPVEKVAEILIQEEDIDFVQNNNTIQKLKTYDVLRKIRSEALQSNDNNNDDFIDIDEEWKKSRLNDDKYIQKIMRRPFIVMTYSSMQNNILKIMRETSKNTDLTVYLDATGSLVRAPFQPCSTILYYALIIAAQTSEFDTASPFPLTDMVSSSHNIDSIGGWLKSFKLYVEGNLKKWPLFNSVVIDFSFAELNSVLSSFNDMDIIEYLTATHNWINNISCYKSKESTVKVFLCCCHLSHTMAQDINTYFSEHPSNSKIIKEIIASLFMMTKYDTVKELWKELTIILRTQFITIKVQQSLIRLTGLIIESDINLNVTANIERPEKCKDKTRPIYEQSPYFQDLKTIMEEVCLNEDNSTIVGGINSFYNKSFQDLILKKYMAYLPLWAGLVNNGVRYSNSHVENYFGTIKRRFKTSPNIGKIPTKIGRFVRTIHERNINIHRQIVAGIPKKRIKNQIPKTPIPEMQKNSFESTDLTMQDSQFCQSVWKRKTKDPTTPKTKPATSFNLTKMKEIEKQSPQEQSITTLKLLSHSSKDESSFSTPKRSHKKTKRNLPLGKKRVNTNTTLPVLQNGTITGSYYSNTCGFDSLIQTLAAGVVTLGITNSGMREGRVKNMIVNLLMNQLKDAYDNRKEMLIEIFGVQQNCDCNILDVSGYILKSLPSLTVVLKCQNCETIVEEERNYMLVNLLTLTEVGFSKLNQCIEEVPTQRCPVCPNKMNPQNKSYHPIISIYTECDTERQKIKICDIESNLIFDNVLYNLIGLITYEKPNSNNSKEPISGHFISYSHYKGKWGRYDDLQKYIAIARNPYSIEVNPHMLVYIRSTR